MGEAPSISVVIVSYNVRELLRRALLSLRPDCSSGVAELIVVDNASADGSVDMVRSEFPEVAIIASEQNRGFSWAVNVGARRARGQALLLLNPDARVPEGSIARMAEMLQQLPSVWVFGFRQVDELGRFQLAVGPTPSLPIELGRKVVQDQLDKGNVQLGEIIDRLLHRGPVGWVAGSSLLVRKSAFDHVGGFDERFFLYFEDIDFCLRIRAAGGEVVYEPNLTVVHHRGASAAKSNGESMKAYRASQLWFWEKHHGRATRGLVRAFLAMRGLVPKQIAR